MPHAAKWNRRFKISRGMLAALRVVFHAAAIDRSTHLDLLAKARQVTNDAEGWMLLTEGDRREIMGYRDGLLAAHTNLIDDRWTVGDDPKLYPRGDERDAAFKGRWHEVKYRGWFYKGTDDLYSPYTEVEGDKI